MVKNVLEWLENICALFTNKTAYKDLDKSITFNELLENSKKIGSGLKTVERKRPIAILGGRRIETIEAFLGTVYSGHIYAPIDISIPDKRIEDILEILRPAAIITDIKNLEKIKKISNGRRIYTIEALMDESVDCCYINQVRKEMISTDPLYVIFTSGSTGRPKGVVTSHQALMCYIDSYSRVMGICEDDIIGNQSPLDYIAAIRDIYLPLYTGATSIIIPKELFMEPSRLFEFINLNQISTVGWSVSAFTIPYKLGAFHDVMPLSLKKICFSGSVMPSLCLAEWQRNLPDAFFVNQYGPTEATASCTYYRVDHIVHENEKLPIGQPYDNYRVFLLNDDLSPTPQGDIGEICISGIPLALGYYNDPENTKKNFIFNPNIQDYQERMYRTGDYGRVRTDGMLEFHGRKDRQIKHLGHRVELDEIEYVVNRLDAVKECLVLYDQEFEIICLFYSGTIEKRELVAELRKSLPGFMIPRKVISMDELPKLSNGKIDMKMLNDSISMQ